MRTMRQGRRAGERGFTLLEVLLGVVLLGAVFAPVVAVLSGGLQGASVREAETRALYLAQARMEELAALDFDQLSPGTSLSEWVTTPDSVYRAVEVQVNPDGGFDPNMKQITVTVGSVVLSTYRADELMP